MRNRPGQQHAAGLASDHAGADHMVPDAEIILRPEMLPDQCAQAFITGHHDIAHPDTLLVHGDPVLMQDSDLVEEAVPGVHILFFQRPLEAIHDLVEPAGLHAVPDGNDGALRRAVEMGQEHGIGGTVPDLLRTDIDVLAVRIGIDVEEQLGCTDDLVDGIEGMAAADDREEGDRIQDEQEGTCDPEEVAHHQVRGPGSLQLRQAVEDIEGILSLLFNDLMDLDGEGLEPVGQGNDHALHFRAFGYEFRMGGKAEVDDFPAVLLRLLDEGDRETAELFQHGYAPDDVVTHADRIEGLVQGGNAGQHFVKCGHGDISLHRIGRLREGPGLFFFGDDGLLEAALSLVFGNVDGIAAGEASVAESTAGVISGQAVRGVHRQVGEGVRTDLLCDFLHGIQAAGNQVFPGIHIGAEEAGIAEGRGGDAHMDFLRAGLPQEADDPLAGGAADDGVIKLRPIYLFFRKPTP